MTTPEGIIKNNICAYLAIRKDCFFWVQESQGTYDPKKKIFRAKKSKYQRNGIPDIILNLKYHPKLPPTMIGFEVKDIGKKQTDSQVQFEKDYTNFTGYYFVVRSCKDAIDAINLVKKRIDEALKFDK